LEVLLFPGTCDVSFWYDYIVEEDYYLK